MLINRANFLLNGAISLITAEGLETKIGDLLLFCRNKPYCALIPEKGGRGAVFSGVALRA